MPNFAEEAEMLEWAGICFGEDDTYRLGKSIKVSLQLWLTNFLLETCDYVRCWTYAIRR